MRNLLIFCFSVSVLTVSCHDGFKAPVMGNHTVCEVALDELSGLCFNQDRTALLACGDKGVIKTLSFDGDAIDLWSFSCDMEGITINPTTGDIYLAIEGKQEVHVLEAPDYSVQDVAFAVMDAVDEDYGNKGLEAVEYFKDGILFVGSQKDANLWQYRKDGTRLSKISLSSYASEIAGLCYEPEMDLLWVIDSKAAKIFVSMTDGSLLTSYDIPFIENAESICVDRERSCVWVGSDEDATKLYRIFFTF